MPNLKDAHPFITNNTTYINQVTVKTSTTRNQLQRAAHKVL